MLTRYPVSAWECRRTYSSSGEEDLKQALSRVIPAKRELLKKVKAVGDKKLGDTKVENTIGGMRCVRHAEDTTGSRD